MSFHELFYEHATMWLFVIMLSFWGGVVRFLMKSKKRSKPWDYTVFLSQITVSVFAGVLGGLYSVSHNHGFYMIIFISAVSGSLGGTVLQAVWTIVIKILEMKVNSEK